MTQRQIDRWLRKRFSQICWVVIAYYLLINLMVIGTMVVDAAKQLVWSFAVGDYRFAVDESVIMENGWGYCLAAAVSFVILYAWKGGAYCKHALFVREQKMTAFVFFCAVSFCMGGQMLNSIWISILELGMNALGTSILPALESVSGSTPSFSMFLYSALAAPLVEEILFRGFVLRSLHPYGRRFSILASAILFGMLHGNLIQTPYAIVMGLIFGYIASVYSLFWAIALHMFNNLILAEGLARITAFMPEMVENVFYTLLFAVFLVASVVILIVKRKKISAWRQHEWIDRRCVKCFLTNAGFLVFAVMMLSNAVSWLMI